MRLDHLLSKEHQQTWSRPHRVGVRCARQSLDGLSPVVGGGLVRDKQIVDWGRDVVSLVLPNTLLGPEATGPLVPWPLCGVGGVLSLHLGGGVWCLICG